jgi:hypothetical protein
VLRQCIRSLFLGSYCNNLPTQQWTSGRQRAAVMRYDVESFSVSRQQFDSTVSYDPFAQIKSKALYILYLDVIHIAIVCGERDLLELRFGSIRSRDLFDLTCLSALQQGQRDESILLETQSRCAWGERGVKLKKLGLAGG